MHMPLDLTSINRAVTSLESAIREAQSTEFMNGLTESQQEIIRAGVIQNFEFTFELCWKFMKRWLSHNIGAAYVDGITRKELFRLAAEHHLLNDTADWFGYHEARNRIAHTYNKEAADFVFSAAEQFLHDAKHLVQALEERND